MKKLITLVVLIGLFGSLQAQTFSLELEQTRQDSVLQVDIYIQKTAGEDFQLGSSSFPFADISGNLDVVNAIKVASEDGLFSPNGNTAAYSSLSLVTTNKYAHLLLLANTPLEGINGSTVTYERSKIAQLLIPIKNKCGTSELSWLVNDGTSLTDFAGNEITSGSNYVGPQAYKLSEELAVPYIERDENTLYVEVSADNYQWYYNGELIENADSKQINTTEAGIYAVTAENDCEKKISADYTLDIITGGSELTGLKTDLLAYPNPYHGATLIQYSVSSQADVTIEVYDLLGDKVATLVKETQNKGIYNLPFNVSEKGYKPGVYVLLMTVGDVTLTQRIVELSN